MPWPPTTHQDVQDEIATLRRGGLPSTWLAIGDSISEGMSASTREHRWISRARDKMRTRAGITGGAGYIPAWQVTTAPGGGFLWPTPWTATGSVDLVDWADTLGKRAAFLNAGATMSITVTGTSVDVWAMTGEGNPALSVTVDGGAPVSLPTNGPYGGVAVERVTFPSRGARTVTVASPDGATLLGGIMVYDGDETSGIRLYDAAHSGWTSGAAVTFTAGSLSALVAEADPDLITVELGVNDIGGGIAAGASAYNVGSLIDQVLVAAPRARVVFVLLYAPAGNDAGWQPYVDELRYMSGVRDVSLLDLRSRMGVATASGYWSPDGLHPSDAGHELIADLVVDHLTRS